MNVVTTCKTLCIDSTTNTDATPKIALRISQQHQTLAVTNDSQTQESPTMQKVTTEDIKAHSLCRDQVSTRALVQHKICHTQTQIKQWDAGSHELSGKMHHLTVLRVFVTSHILIGRSWCAAPLELVKNTKEVPEIAK